MRLQPLHGRKPACDSALIELTGKLQNNGQGAAGSHQGYCVFQTAIDSRVFEHERRVNHLDRLQIDGFAIGAPRAIGVAGSATRELEAWTAGAAVGWRITAWRELR